MTIDKFISPKTIAVIGASHNKEKIGHQIVFNLMRDGFRGSIYPVNPEGGKILGLSVYPNVSAIDKEIDLAIVVVPSAYVWQVVVDCADAKVGSMVIISSGFAESGKDGMILQAKIKEICSSAGITLLGPNCLGFLSTKNHINASFANSMPQQGKVALVSQSGAVITALIDWSINHQSGFSHVFSLGNKAGIAEFDLLEFLYRDPETSTIILYLENLTVTPDLIAVLKKGVSKKPTIALIGGSSAVGTKAALSHTGSVVSSFVGIRTFLEQTGLIVAESYSDLYSLIKVFSTYRTKIDNSFAIITNAGGPSIALCDQLAKQNLTLASWSNSTAEKMKRYIHDKAICANPVDLIGDATSLDYRRALHMIETETKAVAVFLIVTPQTSTDIENIGSLVADYRGKLPILSCFLGGRDMEKAVKIVSAAHKPVFHTPDSAAVAAKALVRFSEAIPEIEYQPRREKFFARKDIMSTLKNYDLPYLPYFNVSTESELLAKARLLKYPVVLKTADTDINHKSESNAVRLNIQNDKEAVLNFKQLGRNAIIGKMIHAKKEIFLGLKKDDNIGNIIVFGTGGIYAELYSDFSRRVAPVSSSEIKKMIMETKMGQILAGYRGVIHADIDQLVRIIKSAEKFVNDHSNISEVDFNPILFDGKKFHIVDLRIIGDGDEGKTI